MKRELYAVALAAALSLPTLSQADTANVNVYGAINLSWELANAAGGTDSSKDIAGRMRLICNSCNFGLKGTEELANNFKAFFQVESGFSLNGGTLSGRNSGVGVSSDFGTFLLGFWDTPYKVLLSPLEATWGTGNGYLITLMDTPGGGVTADFSTFAVGSTSVNEPSFSRRQGTAIQYWSPKTAGITLKAAYAGNVNRSASLPNPQLVSATLSYDESPILLGVGFELHHNARSSAIFGASSVISTATGSATFANSQDLGLKAMAGYKIGDTRLGAGWSYLKYTDRLVSGEDVYKKSSFLGSVIHELDQWKFGATAAFATNGSCTLGSGAECSTTDLGAIHGTGVVSYGYSKRTDVYLTYSRIWNRANGRYQFARADSQVGLTSPTAGADPQAVGIGLRHVF